jgi:peptidoglycan/xylan/chitin deacetylase (PgdA/CDA1 family)
VTIDDGHRDGFTEAFPILRTNDFVATYYVVTGRIGRPGYLTTDELQTMAAAGMEIADHTIHHILLGRALPAIAVREIVGAQDDLQRLLSVAQVTFAYPFGGWNTRVVDDVRAAGFVIAFTRAEGCSETDANRFALPRLRVGPSTTADGLLAKVRACG